MLLVCGWCTNHLYIRPLFFKFFDKFEPCSLILQTVYFDIEKSELEDGGFMNEIALD